MEIEINAKFIIILFILLFLVLVTSVVFSQFAVLDFSIKIMPPPFDPSETAQFTLGY